MSELPKDLHVSRTTRIRIPRSLPAPRETFAVCLKDDGENLIIPGKIYKAVVFNGYTTVTDEEGEASVYPLDFFLELSLSPKSRNTLAEVVE
jgi:hypothetical protein